MSIPLKFKKTYAEIFLKDLMIYALIFGDFATKSKKYSHFIIFKKGWSPETMQEVRDRYQNDFSKIFPDYNFVEMTW